MRTSSAPGHRALGVVVLLAGLLAFPGAPLAQVKPGPAEILAGRDFVPTSRKVDTPLNKLPLKFVDARVTLDEYDKWVKLYEDIFGIKSR